MAGITPLDLKSLMAKITKIVKAEVPPAPVVIPPSQGNQNTTIMVTADWDATSGPSMILNKPDIPASQVSVDWTAISGMRCILNKPNFASVATSGSYTDLSNKPSYAQVASTGAYADLSGKPTIPAAQVASDWTATTGITRIINKPTFAAVASSGSYNDLSDKPSIPGVYALSVPVVKTFALGTAYRAADTTKAALITITLESTSSLTLTGATNNSATIVIGATNAVAAGTGLTVATYKNILGGSLVVGVNLSSNQANTYTVALPAGYYFAVRQTSGTGLVVTSAFEQVLG